MCYLPVHVAMICYLYDHNNGVIPPTESKIDEHVTRSIVLRKLRRTNEDAYLRTLEDLRGDDRQSFSKICHLAFDMTIRSTQTVHQRDFKISFSLGANRDDAPFLGLITIDRTSGLAGLDNTYAFPHLTFQEYLAALYLANLKKHEQMEMIRLHTGKKYMQVVWKFYCGLVNFEDCISQVQHIISSRGIMTGEASLYGLQCAFESQQLIVCDSLVKRSCGNLSYSLCILTLSDMTAVAYVISTTSHPVTQLNMGMCHLHDDHVRTRLEKVCHNKLKCIKTLDFSRNNIGAAGARSLAEVLKSCNNLQHLVLYNNNIGDTGARYLAEALKSCNNLQDLGLSDNNIGDTGARSLADALKSSNYLQYLYLYNNNIGDPGARSLAEALKSGNNLQYLYLSNNKIGGTGQAALRAYLKCPRLYV